MPSETGLSDRLAEFLANSGIPLTLADAHAPDMPLAIANDAFCELSGYDRNEIVGRNCRFLQPEGGAGPVRDRIHAFLDGPAMEERFLIPNVTREGEPFLNVLYLAKFISGGELRYVLGSQFNASRADQRLAALYDDALRVDMRGLAAAASQFGATVMGTFDALASSAAIIARAKGTMDR